MYFSGRLHDAIANGATAVAALAAGIPPGTPQAPSPAPGEGAGAAVARTPVAASSQASSSVPGAEAVEEGAAGVGSWAARLRHGRWKDELKANVCHVPAVALARLEDHT